MLLYSEYKLLLLKNVQFVFITTWDYFKKKFRRVLYEDKSRYCVQCLHIVIFFPYLQMKLSKQQNKNELGGICKCQINRI